MKVKTILLLVILFNSSLFARQIEYYIATDGNDANVGSVSAPFASLERARDVIRQSRRTAPTTVYLREGTYYLPKTFVLSAEDAGTKENPVVYQAYPGEKVIISGGMTLQLNWKPYRDGILQAQTPQSLKFDQFFVNGKRQPMARYPNYDAKARPFNGTASDAFSPSRAVRWTDPAGGYIHAMQGNSWASCHYRITGKNAGNEIIYEGGWQDNRRMGMHGEYRFVENIFEELDASREWYHDSKNNTLYYMPDKDVRVDTALFEIARLPHLIEFQGTQNKPVRYVSLRGLIFRHSSRTFMETKEPLLRSDWTIYRGGAVLLNGAEDCSILDAEFNQVGGNAIFVNNYNRRIVIRGTHIHDAGASGICFVGNPDSVRSPLFEYNQTQSYRDIDTAPGPKTDNYPADCLVTDCLIHGIGVVEKQSAGIQISMSKGVMIRYSSIYYVPRAGINISEGAFGGHVIEYCDVFDTVRETNDQGSLNAWGRDRYWHLEGTPSAERPKLALLDAEKTIIRNSRWRCDYSWDMDLNDGASNYEIYNNLFLAGGLRLRDGYYRHVYNNITVNNTLNPHAWYENSMDVITTNIWMDRYQSLDQPQGQWGLKIDDNVFTKESDRGMAMQYGCDGNSIATTPIFIDPENGDYRLKPELPVLKIGFKNFPMNQFGVQKPQLKAMAETPIFSVPDTTGKRSERY